MSDATADAPVDETAEPKKASKLPLLIGLVLALAGGGGGFYAAWSGLLPFGGAATNGGAAHDAPAGAEGGAHDTGASMPDAHVAFIELPQLVISMGRTSDMHHLRFQASLEVAPDHAGEVETLKPRVVDVLNSYLRALRPADIEAPGALIRIRGQMLRRIQLVAGEDRVRDLLVMEFVLN